MGRRITQRYDHVPDDLRAHEPHDGHHFPVLRKRSFWRCQMGKKAAVHAVCTAVFASFGEYCAAFFELDVPARILFKPAEKHDAILYMRVRSVLLA